MFKRELYLNKIRPDYDTEAIKYITGVRMAGKTSLIKSIIEELIESGIKTDHIILYDLEDKSNCGQYDGYDFALDVYSRIKDDKKYYVFIDEVEYLAGCYEQYFLNLNNCFNISLFITSSGAFFKEILPGYIKYELLPFTFFEMKKFYEYNEWNWNDNLFCEYIKYGGFPERFKYKNCQYLSEKFESWFRNIINTDLARINYRSIDYNKFLTLLLGAFHWYGTKCFADIQRNCNNECCEQGKKKMASSTIEQYINLMEKSCLIHQLKYYSTGNIHSLMSVDVGFRFERFGRYTHESGMDYLFNEIWGSNNETVEKEISLNEEQNVFDFEADLETDEPLLDEYFDFDYEAMDEYLMKLDEEKSLLESDVKISPRVESSETKSFKEGIEYRGRKKFEGLYTAGSYASVRGNTINIVYNELLSRGYSVFIEKTASYNIFFFIVFNEGKRCNISIVFSKDDIESTYQAVCKKIDGAMLNIIGLNESYEKNAKWRYLNIIDFLLKKEELVFCDCQM